MEIIKKKWLKRWGKKASTYIAPLKLLIRKEVQWNLDLTNLYVTNPRYNERYFSAQ